MEPLILLGCGYTLSFLALREARQGRRVLAVTRDEERRAALSREGVHLVSMEEAISATGGAHVAVSIPPEAGLDASLSEQVGTAGPSALVYLSSTGVYGRWRGEVDEDTPVDPEWPGAGPRLQAESAWRAQGARILRIVGIYGPGRGLHHRLRAGALRIPESGGGRICRVHVEDLVEALRVVLAHGQRGATWCVADDRPATQAETVGWLCQRLGLPLPPTVPLASLHESLRGDRAVRNTRLKALGWKPRYPDYTAGFSALLEAGK